ncbi:MAG: rRNA pseudouridine synthase [Clostridiales bacterium]|nr:rRNA pseudouridine synthase [Clostridiales bacterium]
MRLDKFLCDSGFGTRKDAALIIKHGRVQIEGLSAVKANTDITGKKVFVDGQQIEYEDEIYLMMNKKAGVLTAARDKNAPTVMDELPQVALRRGISPVGRLDKDVTGLLLFTTNGELNHRLTSPKRNVEKRYIAKVDGVLSQNDIKLFEEGLDLGDFIAKPGKLSILEPNVGQVIVTEGKFHQVKRMFEKVGKPVLELKRVETAGVLLDESLLPGQFRPLTQDEISLLKKACQMEDE